MTISCTRGLVLTMFEALPCEQNEMAVSCNNDGVMTNK